MDNLLALPNGTRLVGDYRIKRVLGAGGFGITYLAREVPLHRSVAIKEYFPSDFATRENDSVVRFRSQSHAADYALGLERFIEEAQTLARFDHPNIVRVYRYFRANNTAYMVLKFEHGRSFKVWLDELSRPPTQAELDAILEPLLVALEQLHDSDLLHRDIAPDNIIIRANGTPVLIDFGSARGDIARHSRTVSAIVKPGYSPFEQYAARADQQGPWTDIYSLAATLYQAVTARRPLDAPTRLSKDLLVRAGEVAVHGGYRPGFLAAIDRGLNLHPEGRPRSVSEWRSELFKAHRSSSQTRRRKDEQAGKVSSWGTERDERCTNQNQNTKAAESKLVRKRPKRVKAEIAAAPPAPTRKIETETSPPLVWRRPSRFNRKSVASKSETNTQPPRWDQYREKAGEIGAQAISKIMARVSLPRISLPRFEMPSVSLPRVSLPQVRATNIKVSVSKSLTRLQELGAQMAKFAKGMVTLSARRWVKSATSLVKTPVSLTVRLEAVEPEVLAPLAVPPKTEQDHINISAPKKRVAMSAKMPGRPIARKVTERSNRGGKKTEKRSTVRRRRTTAITRTIAKLTVRGAMIAAIVTAIVYAPFWTAELNRRASVAGAQYRPTNTTNVSLIRVLRDHQAPINALAVSKDGHRIVTASKDGIAVVWNALNGNVVRTIAESQGPINAIDLVDDRLITARGDGALVLWDVQRGRKIATYKRHTGAVFDAVFADRASQFYSVSEDARVRLWDTRRGTRRALRGHKGAVKSIAFASSKGFLVTGGEDDTVKLWNVRRRRVIRTYHAHTDDVTAVAITKDGGTIASGGRDRAVKLWDADTPERLRTLVGHAGAVTSLAFSPDGKVLASAGVDHTIKLWDVAKGELLHTYHGHTDAVRAVAFLGAGDRFVSAGDDRSLRFWNARIKGY